MREVCLLMLLIGCIVGGLGFYVYDQVGEYIEEGGTFWGLKEIDDGYSFSGRIDRSNQRAREADSYRNYSRVGMIVGVGLVLVGFAVALSERGKQRGPT